MATLKLSERVSIARLRANRLRGRLAAGSFGPAWGRWRAAARAAHDLEITPQSVRAADPSFWPEVQAGLFGLPGGVADLDGRSPFDVDPPSTIWLRNLHGFSWLRHLEIADDEAARVVARSYVRGWFKAGRYRNGVPAEPVVRARRLLSIISHAPFLLDGATQKDYDALSRGLAREAAALWVSRRLAGEGVAKLTVATALVVAQIARPGRAATLNQAVSMLTREIERQILTDGGHVSRNPAVLIDLLLDWLPLRSCFVSAGIPLPDALDDATVRMQAMVRHLRLGDGTLSRFNGMGLGDPSGIATLLAYDERAAPGSALLRASRYARLTAGPSIVIVDGGSAPPLLQAADAHAGCLSFEMSSKTQHLFVNCGAPDANHGDWHPAARATASHSTLCLAEASSARLVRVQGLAQLIGGVPVKGPPEVSAEVSIQAEGIQFDGAHDGYRERFGLSHLRRITLGSDGAVIIGEDRLVPKGAAARPTRNTPFAIHFHLHPDSEAALTSNGVTILLRDGQLWRFSAVGAAGSLEESTFFAGHSGPRPSTQIVLRGVWSDARENWPDDSEERGNGSAVVRWRCERASSKA